jgi:hypothetical protein
MEIEMSWEHIIDKFRFYQVQVLGFGRKNKYLLWLTSTPITENVCKESKFY